MKPPVYDPSGLRSVRLTLWKRTIRETHSAKPTIRETHDPSRSARELPRKIAMVRAT
jgi:hypothetical protein